MADGSALGVPFLAGIIVLVSLFLIRYRRGDPLVSRIGLITQANADRWGPQLDAIPTIGYSDPILSYISALRYNFFDGHCMIEEGYRKVASSEPFIHVTMCKLMLRWS